MANEVTVPLLPCPSIDEIVSFYEALGFRRTYRQTKPNPYAVVRREDWEMHFFGMEAFEPADSHGTCVVQVPDVGTVHAAFAQGKLAVALDNAVVQGDGRGDVTQAAKLLDGALARITDAPATERVEALAYRAELARRAGDAARAEAVLAELRAVPLTDAERAEVADALAAAAEDLA